jgi:hypothetical protein
MAHFSPRDLPPTRLPQLCRQLRMLALLWRWMPIIVATLFSRPLDYVLVALQAWRFGATAVMEAFVLRR